MPASCTFTKIYQHIGDWLKIVSTALSHPQVIVDGCVSRNKKRKLNHTSKEVKRNIRKEISWQFNRTWCNAIQCCEIRIRIDKKKLRKVEGQNEMNSDCKSRQSPPSAYARINTCTSEHKLNAYTHTVTHLGVPANEPSLLGRCRKVRLSRYNLASPKSKQYTVPASPFSPSTKFCYSFKKLSKNIFSVVRTPTLSVRISRSWVLNRSQMLELQNLGIYEMISASKVYGKRQHEHEECTYRFDISVNYRFLMQCCHPQDQLVSYLKNY